MIKKCVCFGKYGHRDNEWETFNLNTFQRKLCLLPSYIQEGLCTFKPQLKDATALSLLLSGRQTEKLLYSC